MSRPLEEAIREILDKEVEKSLGAFRIGAMEVRATVYMVQRTHPSGHDVVRVDVSEVRKAGGN